MTKNAYTDIDLENPVFEYGPHVQPQKGWTSHREYHNIKQQEKEFGSWNELFEQKLRNFDPTNPILYSHTLQGEFI